MTAEKARPFKKLNLAGLQNILLGSPMGNLQVIGNPRLTDISALEVFLDCSNVTTPEAPIGAVEVIPTVNPDPQSIVSCLLGTISEVRAWTAAFQTALSVNKSAILQRQPAEKLQASKDHSKFTVYGKQACDKASASAAGMRVHDYPGLSCWHCIWSASIKSQKFGTPPHTTPQPTVALIEADYLLPNRGSQAPQLQEAILTTIIKRQSGTHSVL